MSPWRPRRSLLWTPGTRADRWSRALQGPADLVVADLEDGVAPADKDSARAAVVAALRGSRAGGSERGVRINPWPSALASADVDAVAPAAPDLLVVPKVEEAAHVRSLEQRLQELRCESELLLMFESAAGVLRAQEIAAASTRLAAVAFGAEDYAADVGARRTQGSMEVLWARSKVVAVAAAARVDSVDQVFVALDDDHGLEADTRLGVQLGYRGKQVVHPKQVTTVHLAYRPTAAELSWARGVLEAAQLGGAADGGVVVVGRTMVDRPLVLQARRIVALAQRDTDLGSW